MIAVFPNLVDVYVVIVGADRKMALIRGVLNNLAVAVRVLQAKQLLIEVVQRPNAHFAQIAADNQMFVSERCCNGAGLLVGPKLA